jgi:RNA polymerase sigma-70 factor, ECF subfamily
MGSNSTAAVPGKITRDTSPPPLRRRRRIPCIAASVPERDIPPRTGPLPLEPATSSAVSSPDIPSSFTSKLAPDTALVGDAQTGDHAAFEELVRRYEQAVLRLALHLMGSESEAQDIYQEAFLKAYRSITTFRFECSFYTWMYRIVTNLCLDHLRNRRIRREDSSIAIGLDGEEFDLLSHVADSHPGSNPERALLVSELRLRIAHALRKLTPRERLVFELKHYQGLRLRAVGEILKTTEETIKSTLFRATRKLRLVLQDSRV